MEDLKEFAKVFGCILICAAMVLIAVVGAMAVAESYKCNAYQSVTGRATKYEAMECYVQDGGSWYAWTEYKYRLATKGEFTKD